jgi:2-polyprenyl-3-methyl-5-hydroxy-6-metoxy-1,4-benzoquinol methylase
MPEHRHMNRETLVDQSYWDNSYREIPPSLHPPADALSAWINRHVPPANGGTCLEIGCYPGRYLAVLGELGYTLNGIDLTPAVVGMKQALEKKFTTGEFQQINFLDFKPTKPYALVCSFGFIEHFTDWEAVLYKHAELVEAGGTIMVEVPNFRGALQRFLHSRLDAENLSRHNLEAMRPDRWAHVLSNAGFEISWKGYFGKFAFWHDKSRHSFLQRVLLRTIRLLTPLLKTLPEGWSAISPYAGIIAVKRKA